MVARFEQSHGHKQNGRHAAGGGCGSFRAFQRGQALLERGYGGVGRAGVGVAVFRKRKVVRRSFAVGLHKAAAQIQRFGVFTILAAGCCGADGMGFGLPRGMAGLVGGGCRHVAGFNGDRVRASKQLIKERLHCRWLMRWHFQQRYFAGALAASAGCRHG